MSLDLFPGAVCTATGPSEGSMPLHPEEETLARSMGAVRRREFAAGRDCARRAMRALGVAESPVLRGPRRAPRWPEGVVGTITHTRGFCAAAVACRSTLAGIGLDAEQWRPLTERALERICRPEEIASLRDLTPHYPVEYWGMAIFSAKESLYKAYFPLTETYLGFRDAVVRLHPEAEDVGRFETWLTRDDVPAAAGQRRFAGRFQLLERDGARLVVTGLTVPPAS